MTLKDKNLSLLRDKYPKLFNELKNNVVNSEEYEIIEISSGLKTLKVTVKEYEETKSFYMHSKFDPVKEATRFAKEQFDPNSSECLLYGFGLGYHIFEIAKLLQSHNRIYIIENNLSVFQRAVEETDLEKIISDPRIQLIISKDIGYLSKRIKEILNEGVDFIIHPASLKAIPQENEYFKFVMENWNLKKSLTQDYKDWIQENTKENLSLNSPNIGVFFNKFKDIPIVIVSTGPSLDKNIDFLSKVKNKALIISAGSALRPLMNRNVVSDFFVVIDPQVETYNQIKGYEDIGIPLIYLAAASPFTVSKYNGPKFIACNDSGLLKNGESMEHLVDPGGSVATTALDIAIKMGGNPIILVGQDLAFVNGKNHAENGTHLDINSPDLKNMRKVVGQNGEVLNTSLGFLSFKYWIENRIEKEKTTFINATEGGAYINGMKHIKLKDVISDYLSESFNFEEKIKAIIAESGNGYV